MVLAIVFTVYSTLKNVYDDDDDDEKAANLCLHVEFIMCVRMQFVIGEEDDEATLEVYDNDNAFDDFLGRCFYPFTDRRAF